MVATKVKDIEMVGAGSHFVELRQWKEEVYLRYLVTWRGERVMATMNCDRYEYGGGRGGDYEVSEWRVYCQRAEYVRDGSEHLPNPMAPVSDTARSRISDVLKPLAMEWLDSDEYKASEGSAYYHAMRRELRDADSRGTSSTYAREYLARYRDKLSDDQAAAIEELATMADAYRARYEQTSDL